eukprot:SRR837773.14496.p1 GENE.SRR837773.14496~~SRR837773.14496.p1  ORF type:complete len:330 (-),score=113.39 SRR837773.14496:33-953(-)
MIVVSAGKLLLSFALYCWHDGSPWTLLPQLRAATDTVRRYSVVAALYCTYDVLSFVNAALFDPNTFMVLLQLRVVLTAVVWEVAYSQPNSWPKRIGLLLITAGCATKQAGGASYNPPSTTPSFRYITMLVQILANCFAAVANEMLLKGSGSPGQATLPFNAQNMLQYGWTIVWLLLVGSFSPNETLGFSVFDRAVWAPMLDARRLGPRIFVLTILGLLTSLFIKLWDSVWKNVASSIELFMTAFASMLVFGYPVRAADLLALSITTGGIWLFANPDAASKHLTPLWFSLRGSPPPKTKQNGMAADI